MSEERLSAWPQWAHIGAVLALFAVLGAAYSLAIPVFETPDEMAHFAYVQGLVAGHGFPSTPLVIADDAPAQESSQPPVYYLTAAFVMRLFAPDTSDWHTRLTRNPSFPYMAAEAHNDNKNVFIHDVLDTFPYEGTAQALHLARLISLLFGATTVYVTYRLAREVFPGRNDAALLAASCVAFLPQFIFISSAASNDSAAAALCTSALWIVVRIMRSGFTIRQALMLGVLLGLAALSKASALALIPATLLAVVFISADRVSKMTTRFAKAALALGVTLMLAAPWYIRSAVVFGDVLGISTHLAMPWARAEPLALGATLPQLPGALVSWWLAFGWGNILAPDGVYLLLDGLLLIGLAGVAYWFVSPRFQRHNLESRLQRWSIVLLAVWTGLIVVALLRWIQWFDAPLGRLLFPAIGAIAVLWSIGWVALAQRFFSGRWATIVKLLVPIVLFVLSMLALPLLIVPAYARPTLLNETALTQQPGQPIDMRYGEVARLVKIDVSRDHWLQPGGEGEVGLCWEPLAQDARMLVVLVQIVGAENRVVSSRRTLPGLGAYPTSIWRPGQSFCDRVHVQLKDKIPAPAVYQVEIGIIDQATQERLPAYVPDGSPLTTNFVERLKIAPDQYVKPPIERPLDHRFGDQIALMGYDLDRPAIRPGNSVRLRLYWRALRSPEADYTIFAQVRDAANRIVAQKDSPPQGGAYPTTFWDAGEVVTDDRVIEIPADTEPGKYPIKIGLYLPAGGARLKVDGGPTDEVTLPVELEVQ